MICTYRPSPLLPSSPSPPPLLTTTPTSLLSNITTPTTSLPLLCLPPSHSSPFLLPSHSSSPFPLPSSPSQSANCFFCSQKISDCCNRKKLYVLRPTTLFRKRSMLAGFSIHPVPTEFRHGELNGLFFLLERIALFHLFLLMLGFHCSNARVFFASASSSCLSETPPRKQQTEGQRHALGKKPSCTQA